MFEKVANGLRSWHRFTSVLESVTLDNIAATTPWLAPIVPAWLAYDNMRADLGFPFPLAFITALVIEFLGLSTVHTTFQFWDYNDARRKSDVKAPTMRAGVTGAFYLVLVLLVNVLLDDTGWLERAAKALLSLLSLVAGVTLALRAQHTRRLSEIQQMRAERREERLLARQLETRERLGLDLAMTESFRKFPKDWRNLTPAQKQELSGLTPQEIVRVADVTERTAYTWAANLRANGFHQERT